MLHVTCIKMSVIGVHILSILCSILFQVVFVPLFPLCGQDLNPDSPPLKHLREEPVTEKATETIYEKQEVLFCTGNSPVATANNEGAELILNAEFKKAEKVFLEALGHAPLFYPYHYNIGLTYLRLRKFDKSRVHLKKAQLLVPEYAKVYLLLGELYDETGDDSISLEYFRKAFAINRKELKALIKIGDVYFKRNQLKLAESYYNAALSVDPKYSNGLLGIAKIHYKKDNYFRAIVTLKQVDIEKEYNKAYHYYYAECAYKLQDYKTAYYHYKTLLKFRNDPFFISHSYNLVTHKKNLTRRFVDIEEAE